MQRLAGNSGPDPDVFSEYAVFAERAGLGAFQAKWEAVLIDDWEIARQSKGDIPDEKGLLSWKFDAKVEAAPGD